MFVAQNQMFYFDAGVKLLPWRSFLTFCHVSGPGGVAFVILETMPNRLTKWKLLRAEHFVFGCVISQNSYELVLL